MTSFSKVSTDTTIETIAKKVAHLDNPGIQKQTGKTCGQTRGQTEEVTFGVHTPPS